jgi:anti-sigma B factor antagonist
MLNVTVETVGETTILRCGGRIVKGDETRILRRAVLAQGDKSRLIIDLRHVNDIDAAGVGLLLELRQWARSNRIQLRLVNLTRRVQQVLKATRLSHVFDVDLFEETNRGIGGATGAAA